MSDPLHSLSDAELNQNHYVKLGVDVDALEAEIKARYKKLAFQWHPDRNLNNPAAEQEFKNIAMANDILTDKVKRGEFDIWHPPFRRAAIEKVAEFAFSRVGDQHVIDAILDKFQITQEELDPLLQAKAKAQHQNGHGKPPPNPHPSNTSTSPAFIVSGKDIWEGAKMAVVASCVIVGVQELGVKLGALSSPSWMQQVLFGSSAQSGTVPPPRPPARPPAHLTANQVLLKSWKVTTDANGATHSSLTSSITCSNIYNETDTRIETATKYRTAEAYNLADLATYSVILGQIIPPSGDISKNIAPTKNDGELAKLCQTFLSDVQRRNSPPLDISLFVNPAEYSTPSYPNVMNKFRVAAKNLGFSFAEPIRNAVVQVSITASHASPSHR